MKSVVANARAELYAFLELTPEQLAHVRAMLASTITNMATIRTLLDQRLREAIVEHRSDPDA